MTSCIKIFLNVSSSISFFLSWHIFKFLTRKEWRWWTWKRITYHRNNHVFRYSISSIFDEETVPKKIYGWLLRDDMRRLFFLVYDGEHKSINTHTMLIRVLCSNLFCTTVIRTDNDRHLDIQEWIATEKLYIHLHPFHVGNENKCSGSMASDIYQKGIQIAALVDMLIHICIQNGWR